MKINKKHLLYAWVAFLVFMVVFLFFNPTIVKDLFVYLSGKSLIYLYILLFVLGIVRSFTLIPVTYLIILGLIFVPALPLYFIIMSGVMVSSILVFYFFEYLRIDKMLDLKYKKQIDTTKYYLSKYEFPVIFFWAMNPILPSDLICYVAGTLRVNVYKFIIAMLIGEGIACAIYIFGGKFLLNSVFGISV